MPAPPPAFLYDAAQDPDETLPALLSAFDAAKRVQDEAQAALDEAKEATDALNAKIKAIVTSRFTRLAPPTGQQLPAAVFEPATVPFERYELRAPGANRPFILRWQVTHRVDTKRLKAERPDIHAQYAPGVGGWVLERKRGQG